MNIYFVMGLSDYEICVTSPSVATLNIAFDFGQYQPLLIFPQLEI